jgi:hypothetical protein
VAVVRDAGGGFEFSWSFLEEISWWSVGIAGLISAISLGVTGTPTFALGCMLAVAVDVAFIRSISIRARHEIAQGNAGAGETSWLFFGRLIAKAALLVLAALQPQVVGFWGTVVGVLVFDLTLALVGSVIAATRLMRHTHQPPAGR